MRKTMLAILLISCLCAACTSDQGETLELLPTEVITTTEGISPMKIIPLPCTVDLNQLDHCTLDISLEKGALIRDKAGNVQMNLTVYTYDLFDLMDISRMKVGDTIHINGQDLLIAALEETQYGSVLINGGLENGGHELRTDENGVYYETGYSDVKSYYEIGNITLPVSPGFVYIDASDLDSGETVRSLEVFESMYEEIVFYCQPGSTSVVVDNGVITSMTRVYVP